MNKDLITRLDAWLSQYNDSIPSEQSMFVWEAGLIRAARAALVETPALCAAAYEGGLHDAFREIGTATKEFMAVCAPGDEHWL